MPYSGNPGNNVADEVRFLVGDTNTTKPDLTDEEIAFLLVEEGNSPRRAAARAAEVLAALYSKRADEKAVGPLRIKYQTNADRFTKLAKKLWSRATVGTAAPYAGGISQSDKESREANSDRAVPSFSRRLMDYGSNGNTRDLS